MIFFFFFTITDLTCIFTFFHAQLSLSDSTFTFLLSCSNVKQANALLIHYQCIRIIMQIATKDRLSF